MYVGARGEDDKDEEFEEVPAARVSWDDPWIRGRIGATGSGQERLKGG